MITSRDLVAASLTAVVLAARLVLSWQLHAFLVAGVAAALAIAWTWSRHERERLLRRRLAITATAGFACLFVVAIAASYVGTAALLLGATVSLAAAGVRERVRLRGAALSERSEPRERVAFEGIVSAISEPSREVTLWVAQQRKRWWSSSERVELRGDGRKVVIDPSTARAVGESSPYGTATLDGADSSRVRWWQFAIGEPAFVIGNVTAEVDTSTATFRDPPRVTVFASELVLGKGRLADARRRASVRVLVWGAVAAGAAALAGAQLLGQLG